MARLAPRALALAASFAVTSTLAMESPRTLETFDVTTGWRTLHTDDVSARLRAAPGRTGQAICLDYDFHDVSGTAAIRRTLPIDFPPGFVLSLDVRGRMPPNTLQIKFIDDSGDNVWWYQVPGYVPSDTWRPLVATSRQMAFAWGPVKDRTLRHTREVEFTLFKDAPRSSDTTNAGELCFDNLRIAPRPVDAVTPPPPSVNDQFEAKAKIARRGLYPRGFSGEQSYWTLVGVDGGGRSSGLLSEDGAVEVARGGFSMEPFLIDRGKLVTWADVSTTHALRDRYLPMPSVRWAAGSLSLTTTAFTQGSPEHAQLVVAYRVTNGSDTARDVTLALAARPFQVNPPQQFLNPPGGFSAIHDLAWDGHALLVNGVRRIMPLQPATRFVAGSARAKGLSERFDAGEQPSAATTLHDDAGFAEGALLYDLHVPARGYVDVGIVTPSRLTDDIAMPGDAHAWLAAHADAVASAWHERLDRVAFDVPPEAQAIVDTMKSGVAQMLMSRDGPALRPGTRSYARTWIRDGAMMLEGLLRMGHEDVASAFVRWYAPYQFSTGKVPCCVDVRGADPVPENDSPGELIFSIAELWRYTHDRAVLDTLWPHVAATVTYMEALRASERVSSRRDGPDRALYGLMPASISHEGYSAKPMHSYWDDFWALKGYEDAVTLATAVGKSDLATRYAAARDTFRDDLYASIGIATKEKGIDYIPGSAELGDFDATSTTIALSPGGEQSRLPKGLLIGTFETYWRAFAARRDGTMAWNDYTPYEVRTIASFVRLGWRDRVNDLIAFFFAGRRPAAWNQWAEVVGRDPREKRFVGDMPHAWIASDFVRSALDLFAYDRDAVQAMVVGAGIQPNWLTGKGVAIRDLRTPYGRFGYVLKANGNMAVLTITQPIDPPGGLVLALPSGEVRVPKGATVFETPLR